jgi:WD40 repeat protein
MRRYFFTVALVSAGLLSAGCTSKPAATESQKTASLSGDEQPTADIGGSLFEAAEFSKAQLADRSNDPITVPLGHATVLQKQDLPSQVDGKVTWVGLEVTPAEIAERKLTPRDLYENPRDKKVYRRMIPGDVVKRNQVIALLDDRQAYVEFQSAQTKHSAAKEEAEGYIKTVSSLDQILRSYQRGGTAVAEVEYFNQLATKTRYEADLINRQGQSKIAQADLDKYDLQLQKHTIRAEFDGEIQQILKHPGESVRANDPIVILHSLDRLRIEANMPKEYLSVVSKGDVAIVETPRDMPFNTTFEQHTTNRAISKVAVTARNGVPLIVSASEDGEVYAWDRKLDVVGSWRFRNSVKALAVTRPGIDPLLLIGTDDGTARLYDLTAAGKEPLRTLEGKHEGGVTAAAFSPDGRWLVTSDERNIHLWETANGKKKYTFGGREHHSAITALHFTPQCRVVSVAKEPSIRVWSVGDKGARVEQRIDSRTGDVVSLGISPDGSRLLVDADRNRLDIVHLQDGRKERPLITAGESARLQTFAAFSSNNLIATAGGTEGVVQLWKAPTATDRAAECANLITKYHAQPTCAAFSPPLDEKGGKGVPFLVVGTKKGDVHVWEFPNTEELKSEIVSRVTHVDNLIDSSGKTARVLVDIDNPVRNTKSLLRPGSSVTVVIRPKK